jgi:non-ribosomal peptide synthetase component E (peptide arylation enzyme)
MTRALITFTIAAIAFLCIAAASSLLVTFEFKVPQKIRFVPELPKTATGKVQKYVLRGKRSLT